MNRSVNEWMKLNRTVWINDIGLKTKQNKQIKKKRWNNLNIYFYKNKKWVCFFIDAINEIKSQALGFELEFQIHQHNITL